MKKILGSVSVAAVLFIGSTAPVYAASNLEYQVGAVQFSRYEQSTSSEHDYWFTTEDGFRAFDVVDNSLKPILLAGDSIDIDGALVKVLNRDGEMVGALEANLPDGVKLIYSDGLISAVSDSDTSFRCIDNKWVSFAVTAVGDALVCLPADIAAGPVTGFACGAAVGAGITALNC